MILYNGQSLTVKDKFRPESMPLTLEERKSQASLTIGPDAPEISVGDWMRDDTEPGSGILWRVKSVSDQVEKQTRTVALEHISATLRDYVIFGEWEPEGGCTAQAAVNYALAQTGGLWELGAWEVSNPTNPYKFASTTVFGAIETVSASVSGVFWEYDLSAIPFRLHMRLISDSAASEMRMSRNILSLKRSVDRSRMYTRIYPIGADDLHITGDYLSKNENIYGRVDHIETDQSKDSAAELQRWAQERLNTHCEPAVSIQISGLDYSRETGEALDALAIGTRCRVPLPEYGTTILETLTRLQWKDKIAKPEEVTVSLANIQEDVASIFRKVSGSAASNSRAGGRGSKKKKEEDHAWFVDTTDHVAMVAEAIIGRADGETPEHLWSRVATIVVDGEGIHQRVTANADGIARHGTAIEQNENAIGLAVGSYQIDPDKILRYAGKNLFPQTGQTGWYYLDTAVTPNRMYVWKDGQYNLLQVSGDGEKGFLLKAGEIAIALNESGDAEAHIDAKKVILGASQLTQGDLDTWAYGAETGEGVFAKYLTVKRLTAQEISTMLADIGSADLGGLSVDGQANFAQGVYIGDEDALGFLEVDGPVTATSFQVSGSGDYLATMNVVDAGLSNDGKTLYIWKVGDATAAPSITFRKATTLTGAWGGGGHLLTISTDTDANINYKVAFDAPAQTANQYMEVEVGDVTALGGGYISTPINVNTVVYGSGEDDDTVTTRYTKTWIEDISGLLENKTGAEGASPKITANGTYGPGTGYVGIGSVIVEVPRRVSKGTWANGGLTVIASASGSSSASISLDAADPVWSTTEPNKATVAIYDGDPGGSGVNTGFSVTVNASGRYTAGQNSIINAGGPLSQNGSCT